jgi:S1-C subfamily serine protease
VTEVEPSSAAAQAGVQRGDVILDINDQPTTSVDNVSKALDAVGSGRTARIVVHRAGREILVQVRKR